MGSNASSQLGKTKRDVSAAVSAGRWHSQMSLDIFFVSVCRQVAKYQESLSEMMLTQKPQAISGVSPDHETIIEELYPSIAATSIGDFIHRVLDSVPNRIWGMKVSNVLFGLPLAPLAAFVYLWMKAFGSRYVLTNRVVKRVNCIGVRTHESVPLSDIITASVDPDSLLDFYRTGDVRLIGGSGQTLLLLRGVPRPDRFRQVIQEAVDAKRQVASSLATINARH